MHRSSKGCRLTTASLAGAAALAAHAQQMPNPYGENVAVEAARRAAAAAIAEAKRNGWTVAAAVVDTGGDLVYFEKIDGTQHGSTHVAQEKARSSVMFKRPTKAFEDSVKGQAVNLLGLPGAVPLEGGVPIVVSGKIVGALGVSGATSAQDGQCARAGVEAIAGQGGRAEGTAPPPQQGAPPPAKK
ncbi:MAG: GlcG/HbpS family heme-binding protein [Anaeromyxobacteraceae bacterium]